MSGGGTVLTSLRSLAGRLVRFTRRTRDRLSHPMLRRRAFRRLDGLDRPRRFLVLCYGNICRSPYAAARLEAVVGDVAGVTITQGGFFGPDRPAPERAVAAALAMGVDLARHRSRLVTAADALEADLIVVMEAAQAKRVQSDLHAPAGRVLVLGDLDPAEVDSRSILDPYDREESVFFDTYRRIDRCVEALRMAIADHQPPGPRGSTRSA